MTQNSITCYLLTTEGSHARELVESFPPLAENYLKAIDLMKERFGREDLLIELYVRELLSLVLTQAGNNKIMSLRCLYDKLETQLRALETLGVASEKYACMLYPLIESVLPEAILLEWERKRPRGNMLKKSSDEIKAEVEPINELMIFLKREVEGEERISLAREGISPSTSDNSKRQERRVSNKPKVATASELVSIKAPKNGCIFCDRQHASQDCFKARNLDLEEINQVIRVNGCCHKCLKRGHLGRQCKISLRCIICNGKHVPLTCPKRKINVEQQGEAKSNSEESTTGASVGSTNLQSSQVFLKTLKVKIRHGDKEYFCRLFFDEGSQRSYITNRMISLLGYKPLGKERIIHSLFGGERTAPENHHSYEIQIASVCNNATFKLKVLNKEIICDPLPAIAPLGSLMTELQQKNIKLSGEEWGPIDILVGADVAGSLLTGRRQSLNCGLVAFETLLGWTIMGKDNNDTNVFMTNISSTALEFSAEELWKLEAIGIQDSVEVKTRQQRESVARKLFQETVNILEDGRYEVRLPWREDHPPLDTNLDIARKRLESTVKKMEERLRKSYDEVFKTWLADGIIEAASEQIFEKGHYLPHRPIIKEASTTKIRPVFDASAKSKGSTSLNQCLEKGPNLIELIPDILLRFRMERYGVISDVKQAFLQISVNEEDREYLKFLWYDEHRNLKIFRHKRVVFGVTSSPFLLMVVFEHLLDRQTKLLESDKNVHSWVTLQKLKRSLYVDNCVTSLSSKGELERFIKEATSIFAESKFDLRGWEHTDPELPVVSDTPVLGLLWNKKDDTLKINIPKEENFVCEAVTRRTILSLVQRIFDPIGLTAPTTLVPKLLIQQTWYSGGSWDDEVCDDVATKFRTWIAEINYLRDVTIPRWFMETERTTDNISLHIFCDASQAAYAAVCFLRVERNGPVETYLVSAKARVAPMKKCTIPRLELLAALIGARLVQNIRTELNDIRIRREDNWGVFVHNRVKEINTLSRKEEWKHIPGSQNPADLASRGCNPRLLCQTKWWEGPKWLKLPEDQWPTCLYTADEEEVSSERKKGSSTTASSLNDDSLTKRLGLCSGSYLTIIRIFGWILRFLNRCQNIDQAVQGGLETFELDNAEKRILQMVQREVFQGENAGKLSKLNIFFDSLGIRRVRTKIWNRKDNEDFRSPIVLPSDHDMVEKLVLDVHKRNGHVSGQGLLNLLREKYWILRGRQLVKRVVKKCTTCLRFTAKPFEVESPPLPEERVRDARVFEIVGIDLAGPLCLKDGSKVWICITTCAVYRAIHLEIVCDLSTQNFLMAFRRFIARRGRPTIVYSDNGTNFRGADTLFSKIDWNQVAEYSSIQHIDWRFNPPTASWWGGFWERLIGLLKGLLRRILGKASLNAEDLHTVLCECEALVNSRPITYVSEVVFDPVPISPKMFLQEIEESGVPDCDNIDSSSLNKRLKYRQKVKEKLHERFRIEYLGQLAATAQNSKRIRAPKIGEVVLLGSDDTKRLDWPLGIVQKLITGRDGKIRVVKVKTSSGILNRPVQRIFPLEITSQDEGDDSHLGKPPEKKKEDESQRPTRRGDYQMRQKN